MTPKTRKKQKCKDTTIKTKPGRMFKTESKKCIDVNSSFRCIKCLQIQHIFLLLHQCFFDQQAAH